MRVHLGLPGLVRLAILVAPAMVVLVAKYQTMADRAMSALGGGAVTVAPKVGTFGDYYGKPRRIELGLEGNVEWLLAHELGHHVLGHCDETFQHQLEANAMAIKVLQVWGTSEGYAVAHREPSAPPPAGPRQEPVRRPQLLRRVRGHPAPLSAGPAR